LWRTLFLGVVCGEVRSYHLQPLSSTGREHRLNRCRLGQEGS
jgi:hypothetical protein